MKRVIFGLLLVAPLTAFAASESVIPLEPANIDINDQRALQRGAGLFVNSCMGCHSVKYMRWNRVATDIGITEDQLREFLQTTGDAPVDQLRIAMRAEDAERWFGIAPPDLSLTARARGTFDVSGTDWVYNFLLSFYVDDTKTTGVNNLVFPETAMPHVLSDLQGLQRAVFEDGQFVRFEQVREGSMDADEYRRAARDITTFMSYLAEPVQAERRALGTMVILLLLVFLVLAYLTKREYWKDVH
ncbi:MAG: cytochrome c1 [Gammaproteobacteria bacterium]